MFTLFKVAENDVILRLFISAGMKQKINIFFVKLKLQEKSLYSVVYTFTDL